MTCVEAAAGDVLVLRDGLVHADPGAPAVRRHLVVRDGRITDVLDPAGPAPPGSRVVDVAGQHLVAGVVDSHCHLGDDDVAWLLLQHGVTAVRDMWGSPFSLRWRDEVATGTRTAPRVLAASPLLDGPVGGEPRYPNLRPVTSPEEAAARARQHLVDGYDLLKVYSGLTPAALRAVCDEARRADVPVVGHVPTGMTWDEALTAGMSGFEHLVEIQAGNLVGDGGRSRPAGLPMAERVAQWSEDFDADAVRRLADRLAAAGATVCPTLVVWGRLDATEAELRARQPDPLDDVPAAAVARWHRGALRHDDPAQLRTLVQQQQELVLRCTGLLAEHGVRLVVGTDAGSVWTVPGHALREELALLSDAGLSSAQVLQAAVAAPAEAWPDLPCSPGRLRPGAAADLLVLDADPLADPLALTRPTAVVVGGELLERAVLDERVEDRRARLDELAELDDDRVGPMARASWWSR